MASPKRIEAALGQVYSSVPTEVKEAIQEEADRRGLQVSDVIKELLMEKYAEESCQPVRNS